MLGLPNEASVIVETNAVSTGTSLAGNVRMNGARKAAKRAKCRVEELHKLGAGGLDSLALKTEPKTQGWLQQDLITRADVMTCVSTIMR